jgi:hypothetical protein
MIYSICIDRATSDESSYWPKPHTFKIKDGESVAFSSLKDSVRHVYAATFLKRLWNNGGKWVEVNHEELKFLMDYLTDECVGEVAKDPWERFSISCAPSLLQE